MRVERFRVTKRARLTLPLSVGTALLALMSSVCTSGSAVVVAAPAPVPTLIEVNTTGDGDNLNPSAGCDTDAAAPGQQCSLRAAIQRANALTGDSEIRFNIPVAGPDCDTASGRCTIKLTKALPEVKVSLGIVGPGSAKLTVQRDTGGNYRIFNFGYDVQAASVSGLTISKGYATDGGGGGILSNGKSLNVSGCVFSENKSERSGGGISAEGTLNVVDSTFSGNQAPGLLGGGGIYAEGALSVTGSTFNDNGSNFRGGAISTLNTTGVELRVTDSTFERNVANTGGAIGMYSMGSVLYVTNCIIRQNKTTGGSGGIYQSYGTLNVTNSTIRDNEGFGIITVASNALATETNVINSTISANGRGGITTGITQTLLHTLNVINSTISDNKDDPGITIANRATLNVSNSTIVRNIGGIHKVETVADPGTWTVKSSIIAQNGNAGDLRGDFASGGFNLVGRKDGGTGFTQPTDQTGTDASPLDPRLDPDGLKSNGGPTQTIALFPGSPALDKGSSLGLKGTLVTDQRGTGFARNSDNSGIANAVGGDGTDIGAFERNMSDPVPPTVLQLSAATYSVNENAATATITVTRTGGDASAVSVNYATTAATAKGGGIDYTDASGTLNWGAGDLSPKSFTVPIINDALDEDNETLGLTLSSPQGGATLGGQSQAVLTIVDEDAVPIVNVGFASVNEGNSGMTNLAVPVSLSGASGKVVTVRVSTVTGGTATAGTDYVSLNNALVTFDPGQIQKTVNVQVIGDTEPEPDETIFVRLSSPTNGAIGGIQSTARILNDDVAQPAGELQFSSANYTFNEDDETATISVVRSGGRSGVVSVNYTTISGTATPGQDYTSTTGTLTFLDSEALKVIRVPIINDSVLEGNETVSLTLSDPTGGATLGSPTTAQLTIVDNDAPQIRMSKENYSADEGASFVTLTVTRSGDTSLPASVKYRTLDSTDINFRCDPTTPGQVTGAASRKCDYHIASGRLRFAPGEATKSITLSIVDDAYAEGPETFAVTLSDPTGASLDAANANVTITDNDLVTGANPIDRTGFFVRQLYVDLLSREPDQAGLDGWISRIDQCGQAGQAPAPCDRVTVGGDGFLRSAEFFDRQFFVLRLYRTGFGRILQYSEVGDLAYVSGFLSAADLELNKQELVADIMTRAEFVNKYGALSDDSFVNALVQTAGVSVPQSVRDAWVTALGANTKTRAQVFREISERSEVSAKYLTEAQVVSAYYGFFTRNPDGAYLNYLERLNKGEINLSDLAGAFLNAAEYRQRFGL